MDYRLEQLRYQLQEDPTSRVFYQLGEILRREGELDESVEVLRTGLEHHPRYVAAWVSLGRALFAREDPEDAEVAFARALEIDPENAVAARMIGETAIAREHWARAVKALRLAEALSPGDDQLEERIALAERHAAAESEAVADETPPEPVISPPPPTPAAAPPPSLPRRVVALSEEEPFAVTRGDTGVWMVGGDVFSSPAPEAAPAEAEPAQRPLEAEPSDEPTETGVGPPETLTTQGIPLPTLTLARLALEQDDLELAESTLLDLLRRVPDHAEAEALLREVRRQTAVPSEVPRSVAEAKIGALQGWLHTVRLAAERRAQ